MENRHEERIRSLENDRLVAQTREDYQREINERNRQRRTEVVAWLALLLGAASLIMNIIDKVT